MKELLTLFMFLYCGTVLANDLKISNVSLSNKTATEIKINYDIQWDNSWRQGNTFYDGVWVFVKFRKANTTAWHHCTLKNSSLFGLNLTSIVTNDRIGTFVRRNTDGNGSVNGSLHLMWNFTEDGVTIDENVEVKVFGVEMVYIPSGGYYLGSGGNESDPFVEGVSTNPFLVKHFPSGVPVGKNPGELNTRDGNLTQKIPATFPYGYEALWTMKHEISEQIFIDFLNHIPQTAAENIVTNIKDFNSMYSAYIIKGNHPEYTTTTPTMAMNSIAPGVFAAMADWMGLRPMTELEYEKISRGANVTPTPNEYAWGNTNLSFLKSAHIENAWKENEKVTATSDANANLFETGYLGPKRVGLFAREGSSTRELSGATYYGVLNMSDNIGEWVVIARDDNYILNKNEHGDGELNFDGTTNITSFTQSRYYTKGGSYCDSPTRATVSNRFAAHAGNPRTGTDNKPIGLDNCKGGRFVRTTF